MRGAEGLRRWPAAFGVVVTCDRVAMALALAEPPPHPFRGPVYVNGVEFLADLALLRLLGQGRDAGIDHARSTASWGRSSRTGWLLARLVEWDTGPLEVEL